MEDLHWSAFQWNLWRQFLKKDQHLKSLEIVLRMDGKWRKIYLRTSIEFSEKDKNQWHLNQNSPSLHLFSSVKWGCYATAVARAPLPPLSSLGVGISSQEKNVFQPVSSYLLFRLSLGWVSLRSRESLPPPFPPNSCSLHVGNGGSTLGGECWEAWSLLPRLMR